MLEKSLTEDEEKMIDNTMEQLEVYLEVQQMVFYELVSEFAGEMKKMTANWCIKWEMSKFSKNLRKK